MKNYRMSRNTTEHYTSLSGLREAFGLKPVIKKTKDEKRLSKQRESFLNKHKCKACGEPMTYLGNGNILACTNLKCKGIEFKRTDKEGNEITTYLPSYSILDDLGSEIAANIFS